MQVGGVVLTAWHWALLAAVALVFVVRAWSAVRFRAHKTGVVVITGCSTGIGRHAAIALAKRGYVVLAGVRKTQDAEPLVAEANGGKGSLRPLIVDVAQPSSIKAAGEAVRKVLAEVKLPLVALVNNAGIGGGLSFDKMPMDMMRNVMEVNVFGTVGMTQELLPLLKESKGRIVLLSSVLGIVALRGQGAYAASKFAVEALGDCLRREMRRDGVSVSILEPGAIATAIWDKPLFDKNDPRASEYKEVEERRAKVSRAMSRTASSPSVTTGAILHAISSPYPKTRYLVGKNSTISYLVSKLPDRIADKLMATLGM